MSTPTNSVETLRQAVTALLEAWPGYNTFRRIAAMFPLLELYLAGGVVRNAVLRRSAQPKDFDFFLSGQQIDSALEAWADNGEMIPGPYGCPRWFPSLDCTSYCDLIPVSRFTPGLWPCEDITDVLNQFDITANAMAFDLRTGHFFDPQNGYRDASRGVLRCVRFDYPDEPFAPGQQLTRLAVLWFRIVHYATTLELSIEPITRRWLNDRRHTIRDKERFAKTFFPPAIGPDVLRLVGINV